MAALHEVVEYLLQPGILLTLQRQCTRMRSRSLSKRLASGPTSQPPNLDRTGPKRPIGKQILKDSCQERGQPFSSESRCENLFLRTKTTPEHLPERSYGTAEFAATNRDKGSGRYSIPPSLSLSLDV